jgi:uncharacterized membrane protein YcgQ (UPF0703/DUF1980 family)
MKSLKNSNIAFKWLVLFFFCWVVTQFLGYQHRITHSVSQQNHVLESSQYKLLLTYYLQANNLLNDTIRFSTTVETISANAPQPGRSFIVGLKLDY